jgi:hypothetical protein
VGIASYRDSECAPTVDALLRHARHPARLSVEILDQSDPVSDEGAHDDSSHPTMI